MSLAPNTSSPDDPHLLVVDDDERLRALLQRYLSSNGYRVTAAPGAAEARALMKSMEFDLLILDVMMPGESGLDLTQSVRKDSTVPILMLTARGDPADRIAGLELGADDYLPKPFEPRELLLRVNSLLRRSAPPEAPAVGPVKMGEALFDPASSRLLRGGKPVKLTGAEAALLQLFANHAGRPFSRSELCKRLNVALERSIDVQVTRLRRKIEEDPKLPLYLQTVRGVGYMLVPDRGRLATCWCLIVGDGFSVKRFLPRGLFGRSLIIIVAPIVILQAIIAYVFFERDLDTTTRRLARDVAADMAFLVALEDTHQGPEREKLRALAARQLHYRIRFLPHQDILPYRGKLTSTIDVALDDILEQRIGSDRDFRTARIGDDFEIRVDVKDGVLAVLVPRDRVTVSKPDIFILWMVGSSLLLMGIAILFLRNQVRPIERLARAADSFGKGRAVPDFKPYGATEVRRAAQAFITMRDRLERHVTQRTEMLAGVSHDLKTPLTRLKLALAMMEGDPETGPMRADIAEMEHMLDEYLAFARGEGGEESTVTDLGEMVRDAAAAAAKARQRDGITVTAPDHIDVSVKRAGLRRVLANLLDNALKHGTQVAITLTQVDRIAQIAVEDNGPGIAPDRHEEAFRPFRRLDQGRNLQSGGSGLGLAIARDIARAHGGDILLDKSALGGLKATIRLPV